MFNIFKKKNSSAPSSTDAMISKLCGFYESFSEEVTELYDHFPDHNPAELRFFAMSATSVFVQAFGELEPNQLHPLIDKFTEQCIGNMLFYMPQADYSRVHNAYIARFGGYASLIVDVHNAQSNDEITASVLVLMTTIDENLCVDREAFERAVSGLSMSSFLTHHAVNVAEVLRS